MNNEKIIKPENEDEILRIFRKITMSGAVDKAKALEIIIRDFPHFFREPSENEVKRTFNDAMNAELRARALQQTSRLADRIFANVLPTDKPL
jgi:hypothetical protein